MSYSHKSNRDYVANRPTCKLLQHGSSPLKQGGVSDTKAMKSSQALSPYAPNPQPQSTSTTLLPIMGAVFVAFLVIGMALPVLPLHVHQGLGLGTFLVGLVAGSQFAAAILSRAWAGRRIRAARSRQSSLGSQPLPDRGSSISFR